MVVTPRASILAGALSLCATLACAPIAVMQTAGPSSQRLLLHEATQLSFDVSPDGRTIVHDLAGQLWRMPARGGESTPLTNAVHDTSEDLTPVISPDGRRVAFRGDRPGGPGLFVMDLASGAVRRLTRNASDALPSWSPTGEELAFVRDGGIHIASVATGATRRLQIDSAPGSVAPGSVAGYPSWSPAGDRILFTSGNRIAEVPASGGQATIIASPGGVVRAPAWSPDGTQLTYFRRDTSYVWHLDVEPRGGAPATVTLGEDLFTLARWSRDGREIVTLLDGRLRRFDLRDRTSRQIPLSASLEIRRPAFTPRRIRFAQPGETLTARGNMGLALSPDGRRIAMIALDTLWVFETGARPRALHAVRHNAAGLAWSPRGDALVWSAGARGTEDLFLTTADSGGRHRLTSLRGAETRASWSPDGRWIAFLHWAKAVASSPPSDQSDAVMKIRVVAADARDVSDTANARSVGDVPLAWQFAFFARGQESPQWSMDSRAVLSFPSPLRLMAIDGPARTLAQFPANGTFASWVNDSLTYNHDDLLWRTRFTADSGATGDPVQLSLDAAFAPSVARDGSVLYVSTDGLRVRRPDGRVEQLGWPLNYRAPVNTPLLIRNVRIVGDQAGATDIEITNGRITRRGPALSPVAPGTLSLDAAGRWAMPGLIELHAHIWDDAVLPGVLYYGVTTIRDMGSGLLRTAGLRDAQQAGVLPAPRIVFGGWQFTGASGFSSATIRAPADDAARERALGLLEALGGEFTKMRAFSEWSAGASLVRAAHSRGMRIGGHIALPLPLLAAGIDELEHLGPSGWRTDELLHDDVISLLRAAGVTSVPTIVAHAHVARLAADTGALMRDSAFVTPFLRWWGLRFPFTPQRIRTNERWGDLSRRGADLLRRNGVVIAAGSDAPHLPWALHWELEELVRAGFSPREALDAATIAAARVLGAESDLGSLDVGKLGDVVILDADPLADIRNTQRIWLVVQGGRVIDRSGLRTNHH